MLVDAPLDSNIFDAVSNWWLQLSNGCAWVACAFLVHIDNLRSGLLSLARGSSLAFAPSRFDVFLSHDWGVDEHGR